ncbi:hypothetical protein PENSPDRAFT_672610 [Peniophora sp. CONT]|nr:hypothetical protein PENSPDRAFT_672610 [Peniophora sp. CONT]
MHWLAEIYDIYDLLPRKPGKPSSFSQKHPTQSPPRTAATSSSPYFYPSLLPNPMFRVFKCLRLGRHQSGGALRTLWLFSVLALYLVDAAPVVSLGEGGGNGVVLEAKMSGAHWIYGKRVLILAE